MIKISYSNSRDIEDIYFEGGWTGILYIDTTPKASDIKYISNVETKNGREIVKSKIVQEEHQARFIASESLIRVMQKLPLMDDVRVQVDDQEENKVYNTTFEVGNWIGGGAYAQCTLKYSIKVFINKNAKL